MAEQNERISVSVIAFGPIKDKITPNQVMIIDSKSTIEQLIYALNIEKWLGRGLTVALNGKRCEFSSTLEDGDEVALLPPVSGG